jgi:phenylacetic acid degradation operon negative regulatory protein
MKAQTELLLYMLAWGGGKLLNPSLRSQMMGFEEWAYRNGFLRQIQRMETRGLLEKHPVAGSLEGFQRVTDAGMRMAMGGRNPELTWDLEWDGRWRLFLFDMPSKEHALRKSLLRTLRACGCGCLQNSVWISPILPEELKPLIDATDTRPGSLILLEAESRGAGVDLMMVEDAWDFQRVEDAYRELSTVLGHLPEEPDPQMVRAWAESELAAWKKVVAVDPFLPRKLCPEGYSGFEVWKRRGETLDRALGLFALINASDGK